MSRFSVKFNKTKFSKYINSPTGQFMRMMWGAFLALLAFSISYTLDNNIYFNIVGVIFIFFGLAGILDICLISFMLGGTLFGSKIRKKKRH